MNSKHTERWEELREKNPKRAMEYIRICGTIVIAQKHFDNFKRECESWLNNIYEMGMEQHER